MRSVLTLWGLAVAISTTNPTPSAVCSGYGSRLGVRLEAIETKGVAVQIAEVHRPVTSPQALLQRMYSSFVDTAFRSFPRTFKVLPLQDSAQKVEFESEAEQWIAGFSQEPRGEATSTALLAFSGEYGNSSRVSHDSSANISTTSSTVASRSAAASHSGSGGDGGSPSREDVNGTSSAAASIGAGSLMIGMVRSCLGLLHQTLMARVDARPPSFVQAPPPAEWNGYVIMSGGDRNAALAERVVSNHAAFAASRKYAYWWHRGSLVEPLGWQPYWHKVAMLRRSLRRFPSAHASIWIDDDIVLTNFRHDMLREALHRANASVIVTRDAAHFATLNTGIVIVRHDIAGREVLEELWRRATEVRVDGVSLATASQTHCLHEQQAMQEMLALPQWRTRVAVLSQRGGEGEGGADAVRADAATDSTAGSSSSAGAGGGPASDHGAESEGLKAAARPTFNLNTFLRWSHWNAERAQQMRFDADAYGSGWLRGDFAGHCSGLSPVRRALCVGVLLGSVVT